MTKKLIPVALALALAFTGCASGTTNNQGTAASGSQTDAVSSASLIYYQDASLTGDELFQAIRDAEGNCAVATVNEDGTVNLANFVPYPAGDEHLSFTFAENVTKANLASGREGMVSYYIYDKDAAEKNERNRGARFRIALETDQKVIDQLAAENPEIPAGATFVRILEVLPLG